MKNIFRSTILSLVIFSLLLLIGQVIWMFKVKEEVIYETSTQKKVSYEDFTSLNLKGYDNYHASYFNLRDKKSLEENYKQLNHIKETHKIKFVRDFYLGQYKSVDTISKTLYISR